MEFGFMLSRLWRHRLLVALGLLVAAIVAIYTTFNVDLSAHTIKSKRRVFGAAQSQFYVDSRRPSLVTSQESSADLIARARTVAAFVGSPQVRSAAARSLDIPAKSLIVTGPLPDTPGSESTQPVAQQRANDVLGEGAGYSVLVDTEPTSPTVTLYVQAPTGDDAARVATAIRLALSKYLVTLYHDTLPEERRRLNDRIRAIEHEEDRTVSRAERRERLRDVTDGRTVVRSLGAPVSGNVVDQSRRLIAVFVFVGAFLAWCVLVILLTSAVAGARRSPAARMNQRTAA